MILAAIKPPAKGSVLSLSSDLGLIRNIVLSLRPAILHLGAATEILTPAHVRELKNEFPDLTIMRSIPVATPESLAVAKSYDGIVDFLLLDSYSPRDKQIGALGTTHDWYLDKAISQSVSIPIIIAGGLGPSNVAEAIKATHPAGVDSKTKTDKDDGSHSKDLKKVKQFADIARRTA